MKQIEFAIEMEKDGERFYLDQADKHKGLRSVFHMLAEDERSHAAILKRRMERAAYDLEDNRTLEEARSVFAGLPDFHVEIKDVPDQLDLYRAGVEMEKESIKLYEDLLEKAETEADKDLYRFLVREEIEHRDILEELVLLVSRPAEWVESAEFGLRTEY